MKKVSVVVACYNEQENILPLSNVLTELFKTDLAGYKYEIIFIDNDSTDGTRRELIKLCTANKNVKAIFNAHNFGSIRSSVHGLLSATGDCVLKMCADFQDPPELIIDFVKQWEKGNKIVLAIRDKSAENRLKYFIRNTYYRLIRKIAEIDHIDNFVGYGLYDKDFMEIVRQIKDPMPYFRGIVAELGYKYGTNVMKLRNQQIYL